MVAMEECSTDEQKLYESSSLDNLQVGIADGISCVHVLSGSFPPAVAMDIVLAYHLHGVHA